MVRDELTRQSRSSGAAPEKPNATKPIKRLLIKSGPKTLMVSPWILTVRTTYLSCIKMLSRGNHCDFRAGSMDR